MSGKTAVKLLSLFAIVSLYAVTFLLPTACTGEEERSVNLQPTTVSGTSWMYDSRNTIGNRLLTDIAIPGTHDSGTYGITSTSAVADDGKGVSKVIIFVDYLKSKWYYDLLVGFGVLTAIDDAATDITSWWSKTQRNNFQTQLNDGIRYFDLRVEQSGSNFYCVHSLLGANLADLFTGIQSLYSNANSNHEILLLDFQHTFNMNNAGFVALLKTALRDSNGNSLLIPRGANLTLNNIWATNQRIIVFFDDDATVAGDPDLWYSSSSQTAPQILSPWPNTNDQSFLYNFLAGQLSNDAVDRTRKGGTFVVLQSLATEGFSNVALSIEEHIFNLFGETWIIDKILKRMGFDIQTDMNFFDFNFGGTVLSNLLDNSGLRNLAAHCANIFIIDDYSNFTYNMSGGGSGGYLDLINELNNSRGARGPYYGVVTYQTPNITTNQYEITPVEIDFLNTGSVAWDTSVVYLGTADPYDRTTDLYRNDGNWISQNRIRMQNTSPVLPGQTAIFKFTVTPDVNFTSSYQSFELVADAADNGIPAQWFGNYYGNTAIYIQYLILPYGSQLVSQNNNIALGAFDVSTLTATFVNAGTTPWYPDTVFLGIDPLGYPPYPDADADFAFFYPYNFNTPHGNWETPYSIRMQGNSPVMPGQDATFTFDIVANPFNTLSDNYTLQLFAAKNVGSLPPQSFGSQGNVTWNIAVTQINQTGALTGQLVSKSPDCTIAKGQSRTLNFVFKNTGQITWYPDMTKLVYVSGNANLYTNDGNWMNTTDIMMQNTDPVQPGGEATFEFAATPDDQAVSGIQGFQMQIVDGPLWGSESWNIIGAAGSLYVTVGGNVPFPTPYVWVANGGGNTVTKLDNSNGNTTGTYPAGNYPWGIAVDASGNVWVTAGGWGTTVTKINGSNGSIMGTYPVGDQPYGIAVDASGNVWVANYGDNTVTKLDGTNGSTIGTYPNVYYPCGIAVDGSGNVWVANNGNNTVSELNGSNGTIMRICGVGSDPLGIAVDASGNVWVTNSGDGTVTKLNGSNGNIIGTYPVGGGPAGIAVDASGNVWVACGSTVTELSGSDGGTAGTFNVRSPFGIAVDGSGNVWVTNGGGNTVTELNGSNGGTLGTYNVGSGPTSLGDMTGFALQYFVLKNTLGVTTTSLPPGTAGIYYGQMLTAAGGVSPYTWSISSGSLPAGLSLDSNGLISGTPTAAGTGTFTVRVADNHGATATQDLSILVNPAGSLLTINTVGLPSGTVGSYYASEAFHSAGGVSPYTWSISGSLPAGLYLNSNGTISGTPTTAGTGNFTVEVTDGPGSIVAQDLSVLINPCSPLTITPVELPSGSAGDYYEGEAFHATGGVPPYAWSIVSGSLPAGHNLNPDGVISGTPTAVGVVNFTVEVTDSRGETAIRYMSIQINPAGSSSDGGSGSGTAGLLATGISGLLAWLKRRNRRHARTSDRSG